MNDKLTVAPSNTVRDLNERFNRLIKQMGANNKKGSTRYDLEVDFAYAINEIDNCPVYLQGKMIDLANEIVTNLVETIKQLKEEKELNKTQTA